MMKRAGAIVAGALAMGVTGALPTPALAENFSFVSDGLSLNPGITPGAFLTDSNVSAVDAFLSSQGVKVIKIASDVSPGTVAAIYGKHRIDYTFLDFEGQDAPARTLTLVNWIKTSGATGPALAANRAFVGNYQFYAVPTDRTLPGNGNVPTSGGYFSSGLNMATEDLYPGSPSFRNPASGDSDAPNVRSALFTMPIERLSLTAASLPAGHAHVPYVNRFNNYGNSALDSDGNPHNGFAFVTADQLPSRGDFKAQVLHYRLRGADGVQGLDGGVVGYTQQQFQSDIVEGWQGTAQVREVLADPGARIATLDTQVKSDGVLKGMEQAGVAISGAYSNHSGKLVLLMSNLDAGAHEVAVASKIGGKVITGEYLVEAGQHQILEFSADGTRWVYVGAEVVFSDNNRGGVGVPEPGTLGLAAAAAMLAIGRRRRRN